MSVGDFLMDITRLMIPGIMVAGTVFVLLSKYLTSEQRQRLYEIRLKNQKDALPIRLQAYERITILLERMAVNNLILRVNEAGMDAADLRNALLMDIRAEFEHNFSQQLYISADVWSHIQNAKEETIRLINFAFAKLPKGSSALDLSKSIFELSIADDYPPFYKALLYLKKEVSELF
jgi:hypothetical protein